LNSGSVGIFGVGAVGGSIGLRARHAGLYVLGADSDEAALHEALALGAIDAPAGLEEISGAVDTYVIAVHLGPTLREIERLANNSLDGPSLIIDVSSVKVPVARDAGGLRNFIATHPIAGTELRGVRAARADLFVDRTWAYVPSGDAPLDARACGFIDSMGAVPFAISAEEHDRAVALSSHVPQLVASCYARILASSDSATRQLCGPVARELLRIAGMSFEMWRDLLQANAANIDRPLRALSSELEQVAGALAENDMESLRALFGESAP
jgi:prephenate dehydrogenase